MKKKKLIVVFSNVSKALAFEWAAEYLSDERLSVHYVLLNNKQTSFENYLINNNHNVTRIDYKNKLNSISVFFKLIFFFRKQKPDIIHCHLFDASIIGLTAARVCAVKKRIYTRHHSTLNHDYFPQGVKYDKWCNRMSTNIIAISNVVKQTLIVKENVSEEKIAIIRHGFKLSEFENINFTRIDNLRKKYQIPADVKVIGVISRYLELKGVTYIIEAFQQILKSDPNVVLILANAKGDYAETIRKELKKLPTTSYIEIEFEEDLFALYQLFDVFIHVPIDVNCEAFGQTYVEALAAGIPSVFTLSGIASEFIENNKNAIVVNYKNSNDIKEAVFEIFKNDNLRNKLIQNGRQSSLEFSIENYINKVQKLYLN
ncbi:MAG: glycosyltransferase family 4 protein [Bacteroidetes bacterium]|nr:glycosyltransferase family 4 protein [Bacteroidota bacterium]